MDEGRWFDGKWWPAGCGPEGFRHKRGRWQPPKMPACIWSDGFTWYTLGELARRWQLTHTAVWAWARLRPEITMRYGKHLYCRDERGWPLPRNRTSLPPNPRALLKAIERDGFTYYPLPELARRRGTTLQPAHEWARLRPELTIRHDGHVYCRDERDWPLKPHPNRTPTRAERAFKAAEECNAWRVRLNAILYPPW